MLSKRALITNFSCSETVLAHQHVIWRWKRLWRGRKVHGVKHSPKGNTFTVFFSCALDRSVHWWGLPLPFGSTLSSCWETAFGALGLWQWSPASDLGRVPVPLWHQTNWGILWLNWRNCLHRQHWQQGWCLWFCFRDCARYLSCDYYQSWSWHGGNNAWSRWTGCENQAWGRWTDCWEELSRYFVLLYSCWFLRGL